MNKNVFLIIAALIAVMGTLVSCNEKTPQDEQNENSEFKNIQIINKIELDDLPENIQVNDLKLITLDGEVNVGNDGTTKVMTYEGYLPQVMMLTDSNDELLLMSRGNFREGETCEMSARSTAIALVTMHPALSGVKSSVYKKLEQLVTESSSFGELEDAIAKTVRNGQSFADPENVILTTALNKVFEQVVTASDGETTDEELPDLEEDSRSYNPYSRAPELKGVTTIAGINVGPFHVTTSGSKVVIENYSLTPLYSGQVTHHNQIDDFDIPSGGDRGVTFFFDNSKGSEEAEYSFTQEGEYQFFFDKTTAESYWDQARHTICNILEVLGLPLDKKWILETADDMLRYAVARGLDVGGLFLNPGEADGWSVTRIIYGYVVDYCKDGNLEKMLLKIGAKQVLAGGLQFILKRVAAVYTVYEVCRGSINAVMRVVMRLESPDNVKFGLYYYQGEITTATEASLVKYSGDGQRGLVGRRLNEPVRVKVTTIGSDGTEVAASNFHRVRFETDVRNGITLDDVVATDADGYAQTFWTLDPENAETQYLKAVVIDIVTGEVISEEVTFSATPTQSADVTFTLEWNRTDSNCDIDLHVLDPEGHRIYYGDMACFCGGYLDRDDRHGPGPEHIYFTQAKPGKYRVYVHHYDSDTRGTVGFTVTTEYGERRFVDISSVSYHELEYIGTLEVSETWASETRTIGKDLSVRFYYDENAPAFPTESLPEKK